MTDASLPDVNRQWVLVKRPVARVDEGCFELREAPMPEPAEGQVLVRTKLLSFEPAMRGWIDDRPNYLPPVEIGAVMRGMGVAEVVASRLDGVEVGDLVSGTIGWQEFAVGGPELRPLPQGVEPGAVLSVLGMTGVTAYFGLLDIGEPKAGETVVVSGAAGATGSVAGQIAKIKGCRTIGIAGGEKKCDWLTKVAGFDGAIDYKRGDIGAQLDALCPDGIDVFFDNVGGEALDQVLARINMHARVVICGAIERYSMSELPPGPSNYINLMVRRSKMQGFVILDYAARFGEAQAQLAEWVNEGRVAWQVDLQRGFENVPATLIRLYTGENFGKQLLEV